jgi:aminoglycoside phosphotransferase (APT) family kinase protein
VTERGVAGRVDARDGDGNETGAATRAWLARHLAPGERVTNSVALRGGWTSRMRRIEVTGPTGNRAVVLRSFVTPFFLRHAEGLLTREATVLRLLADTAVPAPTLLAVDPTGAACDHPSLLMSLLPGAIRLGDSGADQRAELMARQLLMIHQVPLAEAHRPRAYQAWTSPERVRPPASTDRPELWRRAVDVIRHDPPAHTAGLLHRDFHPGNVLFTGPEAAPRVGGVVDWVETSWGPADLDVAHCATALALLHGPGAGMAFADRYRAAGGRLAEGRAHLYWRVLDALAFAPDAEKVAVPWRESGRADLTPALLAGRLADYLAALFDRYA